MSSIAEKVVSLSEQVVKYKSIYVRDDIGFTKTNQYLNYDIIKIPVIDSKENVVATIGIIQPAKVLTLSDRFEALLQSSLEKIDLPLLIFANSGKVTTISNKFLEMFELSGDELAGAKINDVIGNQLSDKVMEFLFSEGDDKVELNLDDYFSGEEFKKLKLHLYKIYNNKNILSGGFITLDEDREENIGQIMEEKIYEVILNSSPQPIFIYDSENLIFLDANNAALELYGYDKKSFLTMDLTDLYSPENIQTLLEENETSNHSGWSNPIKNKRKDGSTIVVRMSKTKIRYTNKEAVLTYLEDVSKVLNVEKEIKEFRTFSEIADEPFVETDKEGFITKVNLAFVSQFSYSEQEISGDSFITLISDNDRGSVNKKVFLNKSPKETEMAITFKTKTGKMFSATVFFLPILDYFNEVLSHSIFIKPENNASTGNERIVKTESPAETSSVSGIDASFLGHLFHELLTPINVIIGFSQELAESIPNPTPEQIESAEIIKENQKSLTNLMDAASEYVALEQNAVEIKPVTFSIVDILEEIEDRVRKVAASYGVELKYGKISSSITLINDKERIISLIGMLWEFAVRGTKEGQVYLSAMQENGKVLIIVRDEKKSISQNLLVTLNEFLSEDENIIRRNYGVSRFAVRLFRKLAVLLQVSFTEFRKGNEVTGFVAKLPVAIDLGKSPKETSKNISDTQNIQKPIVNENPIGTTKSEKKVEKPIEPSVQTVNNTITNRISPANKKVADDKIVMLSELSCLLLEDQIDSQILFKQQMKELKSIEIVTKFEDALPLLKQKKFDFIVMDINLQGEYNGLDALHEIRNIPIYNKVPIIAVTAYVMPGDHDNYIRAGFDDFISKPVMREKMIASLKKVL